MRASEIELQKYKDYAPTGFDIKGMPIRDSEVDMDEWLVGPCGQNRDSDALVRANFDSFKEAMTEADPEGNDYFICSFGHWACGWFEIVLVKPDTKAHLVAQECAAALENYPVLDDQKFSEYEDEECHESWNNWQRRDITNELTKKFELSDRAENLLIDFDDELLDVLMTSFFRDTCEGSWHFDIAAFNREDMAALLWKIFEKKKASAAGCA